jgi:hypothetical protein
MSRLPAAAVAPRALAEPATQVPSVSQATRARSCCKTGELSRRRDQALERNFPAGDSPSQTDPVGDARHIAGCGCAASEDAEPAVVARSSRCCGGAGPAGQTKAASR